MGNFCGQNISATYKSILNIGDANAVLPSTGRCIITDSTSTPSALAIGRSGNGICVTGEIITGNDITAGGNGSITGSLNAGVTTLASATVTNSAAVGGALTVTGNLAVQTNKLYVDGTDTCTTNNVIIGGTLTVGSNTAVTGCITATQDIIAYSSSDKRFKDDLNKICNTKDILNGLTGYSFKWNETSGREGNDLGIIAQDVKKVLPEIVQEREDGYLAVDYPKLIPVLIEEVKRLSEEIEELKKA